MKPMTVAQAGGVACLATEADPRLDEVAVRHFQHPALGSRVVARLVPKTLERADELSMEFHGFESSGQAVPVGRQLRKGLGFPAWALVNDPARGSLALEVVKEFRAQARLARSRPGAAKEGFGVIAERLGASVPHFVPSFFEEAGRVFLEHGNAGMATQMFSKAREAEKVHALSVDENLRRDSFLEFALAGAISVKALTTYAQDLSKERDPQEAYQQYRELCLRRTLGGMPPWAAMLKDLKRLAKAAGLDPKAEEKTFVSEVLSSASLARAPIDFWSTAKESIAALYRENVALGVSLLKLRPVFGGDSLKHGQTWLELLEGWGLTRHLIELGDPALARGEAAAWLSQMMGRFSSYSTPPNPDGIFALARRMAPRLKAEEAPVLVPMGWRQLDLDLVEEILGLGVAIKVESPYVYSVDLPSWAAHEGAERGRDLVHSATHPAIEPFLRVSLDRHAGNAKFQAVTAGKPGWTALRHRWLEHQLDSLEQGGIPELRRLVETWEGFQWPRMLGPHADLRERLARLPLATLVARTLRGFVPQELTWPALESAIAELNPDGKATLTYDGYYPYLVVHTQTRAIAVGPDAVAGRYDLRLPQGARLSTVLYIGEQFLVVYYHNYEQHAVWSGGNLCQIKGYRSGGLREPSAWLPGVGLTYGARAVQGGDPEIPDSRGRLFCDGESCWYQDWSQGDFRLREFDPRTGKEGRSSLPTFLEEFAEPEAPLVLNSCALLPLPNREQTWGWRLRRRDGNRLEGQSQDGWRFETELKDNLWPAGSFEIPGGRIVICQRSGYQQILEPQSGVVCGESLPTNPVWPLLTLAPHWWTLFHPRHQADSIILRGVDDATAAAWIQSDAKISLSDPVLRQGVVGMLEDARQLSVRLAKFAGGLDADQQEDPPIPATVLEGILQSFWIRAENNHDLRSEIVALEQMVSRARAAQGEASPGLWKKVAGLISRVTSVSSGTPVSGSGRIDLNQATLVATLVGNFAALAWRCVAPFTDPAESSAALDLLERWATSPLMKEPEHFRRVELKLGGSFFEKALCQVQGSNGYLLERLAYGDTPYQGLEYHPKAAFQAPQESTLVSAVAGPFPWDTAARLEEFVKQARKRGVRPWTAEQATRLSELTGLSLAEACLLCCGLPGLLSYEANFLSTEIREALDLKAADARIARDGLKTLSRQSLLSIYTQAMPDDMESLWTSPEAAAEKLAQAWNRVVGARLAASAERLKELADLGGAFKPPIMLGYLATPQDSPYGKDGRWSLGANGELMVTESAFTEAHLVSLTAYLSFLYEYAPTGDPLRAAALRAWPLAMQRLRHPELMFASAILYSDQESQVQAWRQMAGSAGFHFNESRWYKQMVYHPARYQPDADVFRALQPVLVNTGWLPWMVSQTPDFQALVARMAVDLPPGLYEGNPLVSAPELIAEIQQKLGLSQSAGVLYLQTLALARPTSKNVQLWNGWTAAGYKQAAQELVGRGLLLEAKRARAGRSHFLPGGWEELKAPHLPLETWKLPLYQIPVNPPCLLLDRVLALRPVGETFALAWSRVLQGDTPAYDESKAVVNSKKGRPK